MLKNNGEFVEINQHNIHIYRQGNENSPKIVFMAGSGTVAPVYDFKILYEKLVPNFRIIVIEKFGYGYSDIFDTPCDIDTLVSIQKRSIEHYWRIRTVYFGTSFHVGIGSDTMETKSILMMYVLLSVLIWQHL